MICETARKQKMMNLETARNPEKSGKIRGNPEKSVGIRKKQGKSRKIRKKSRKIRKNL